MVNYMYCLFISFAVFDLSPLTMCINCTFLHLGYICCFTTSFEYLVIVGYA